jgi:DNA-3-methyladenine glycosylase I
MMIRYGLNFSCSMDSRQVLVGKQFSIKGKISAKAFDDFDYEKISKYTDEKLEELRQDAGIIRNKLKIAAQVTNAKAFIEIQKKHGSFDNYIWQFTCGKTIQNSWSSLSELPATSPESDAMSKQMKKDGFKFVGSTICYANDASCRYG